MNKVRIIRLVLLTATIIAEACRLIEGFESSAAIESRNGFADDPFGEYYGNTS